jgi:hypothetical protein
MAATRTRKRSPFKGRSLVAMGLAAFIVITSLVVWRRSVGVSTAKEMRDAQLHKRSLETERVTLRRDIRDAQTRQRVLTDASRRLGLHVAPDSQTRVLAESGKMP